MVPPCQVPPSNDDDAILTPSHTLEWRLLGMQSSVMAFQPELGPGRHCNNNSVSPSRFKSPPTVSHICIQASWLPVSDNNSLRCLTYHASATLISGSAANFLLFSCVINFFHFASVPCLLWYFKLIADIIATSSVDATSGKNLWYVDYTSCCSDTTLVWNRTRPPSYCPNTSQLFISLWFSKYKKQYYFDQGNKCREVR